MLSCENLGKFEIPLNKQTHFGFLYLLYCIITATESFTQWNGIAVEIRKENGALLLEPLRSDATI